MTVQIPDTFRLDGSRLSILGVHGGPLFAPAHVGWETESRGSSNWRGCTATYAITAGRLVLSDLSISLGYDLLQMTEPMYVVEVCDPRSGEVERLRVRRQTTRFGAPGAKDIHVELPDLTKAYSLTHVHPDRFELSAPYVWLRIADGEEVEMAPYRLRPRVASGFAAIATSPVPRLLGYEGRWSEGPFSSALYRDMASPIPFTGGLILGADYLVELRAYGGRPAAWQFGRVEELIFEEGALSDRQDRSVDMACVRAEVAELPPPPVDRETWDRIEAWTKACFELDYL